MGIEFKKERSPNFGTVLSPFYKTCTKFAALIKGLTIKIQHMKKLIFIFVLLHSLAYTTTAQRAHVVYVEGIGAGIFYSLNYDVRLFDQPDGFGFRLGANVMDASGGDFVTFVPVQANYVLGKKHALEIGAGFTYSLQHAPSETKHFIFPNAAFMYRFQADNGFNLRAGWSPVFTPDDPDAIFSTKLFWFLPAVSLGYRF